MLNAVFISQLTSRNFPMRMSLMQSFLSVPGQPPLDDFELLVNGTKCKIHLGSQDNYLGQSKQPERRG